VFNDIDFTKTPINKYFNHKYLSPILIDRNVPNCSRYFNMLEYTQDTIKAKLQYGYFNPDYPAPIQKYHFVIDTDVYYDFLIETREIEALYEKLHDCAKGLFEDFITDEMRARLNA
jgi:uncharacterized protein (TIGR04255 family)